MRTYVLIGGIGSGKSTVSRMFARLGAACIDLDAVGHDVLDDAEVRRDLACAFGQGIVASDGAIDRAALAKRAFATPEGTQRLNGITQPRIVERALRKLGELSESRCGVAIVEISPYAGPGGPFDPIVDRAAGIVAVVAPEEVRVARAVERGLPEDDVRNRISRQAGDDERRSWASIVVENSGDEERLRAHVEAAWSAMTR